MNWKRVEISEDRSNMAKSWRQLADETGCWVLNVLQLLKKKGRPYIVVSYSNQVWKQSRASAWMIILAELGVRYLRIKLMLRRRKKKEDCMFSLARYVPCCSFSAPSRLCLLMMAVMLFIQLYLTFTMPLLNILCKMCDFEKCLSISQRNEHLSEHQHSKAGWTKWCPLLRF